MVAAGPALAVSGDTPNSESTNDGPTAEKVVFLRPWKFLRALGPLSDPLDMRALE